VNASSDIEQTEGVERSGYDLAWSRHGNVMVMELSRRPAPLSPRGRQRVASSVTVALIATAAAAVLALLGHGWGAYLLVIPIIVFGLLLSWSQLRSYRALKGQRTIGVSCEVIRVHSLADGAGTHEVGDATRLVAEDDRVVARTGNDELVLLSGLEDEDAARAAEAVGKFVAAGPRNG
jgi:hypothetical protein